MRRWTAGLFESVLRQGGGGDGIVWLEPTGTLRSPALSSRRRPPRGAGIARATVLVGLGCVASGTVSNTALAPVGRAEASIERVGLKPLPALAPIIEPRQVLAPTVAAESELPIAMEEQEREVEEFLSYGSRHVPRRMVETIVRAANETGVDPIYLMALADTESSFRPDAKASTSSAEGLFQFVDRTWLELVRTFGAQHGLSAEATAISTVDGAPIVADEALRADILALRREPFLAAVMAAELLKKDAAMIGFRIGRKINRTEMYLAHFLGLEGAARFIALRERKRPPNAAKAFPGPARANAGIFFRRHKRGKRGLSVSEVYARIDRLIGERTALYRDVEIDVAENGRRL